MDVKFPKGFYFGSATSAPQSEGAHGIDHKAPDIWDLWYESNFGAAEGSPRSLGLLVGGLAIVIVSGIYLFVKRKR